MRPGTLLFGRAQGPFAHTHNPCPTRAEVRFGLRCPREAFASVEGDFGVLDQPMGDRALRGLRLAERFEVG